MKYIISVLIIIIIGLTIYCNVNNKESFCSIPLDYSQIHSFMSTDQDPDFLIIKEGKFNIYKFNGQNLQVNPKYFSFKKSKNHLLTSKNHSLTSKIDGVKQKWVKCPLRISPLYYAIRNISLDQLKSDGGIYCNENNIEEPITVVSENNIFSIESIGLLELVEPFANTRQQMDKLKYFKGINENNGLIGNIKGYRDKDQKFKIEWIRWSKNGKCLNYGCLL